MWTWTPPGAAFSCECAVTVANAKAHNVPNMASTTLQLFIDDSSLSESTLLLDRTHKNPPLMREMREHGSCTLGLRLVADAIPQFVADKMKQYDWQN